MAPRCLEKKSRLSSYPKIIFKTSIKNEYDYLLLLINQILQSAGITSGLKEDLESATLKIYTGKEKGMLKGVVRDAVNQVITTEQYILRF